MTGCADCYRLQSEKFFNKGIFIERYRIREIPKKRSAKKC